MTPVFVIHAKAGIHSPISSRTSISDTYKFIDSRFRGNDNDLRSHQVRLKHKTRMSSKTPNSGQSVLRLEDDRLLRGQGRFVDNLNFEGQVYLHVVRSYLGHAKILNIQPDSACQ